MANRWTQVQRLLRDRHKYQKAQAHTIRNIYYKYIDFCVEEGIAPITRKEYVRYFDMYFEAAFDRLINKNMPIELPMHMGEIRIEGFKKRPKTRAVDWGLFKREGIYAYHPVVGTHKFLYKFKWFVPSGPSYHELKHYELKINKEIRLRLSRRIEEGIVYEILR